MATGRSDFPNQVNNVLGFLVNFRGALDIQATGVLPVIAKEEVLEPVCCAYNVERLEFGRGYLVSKPFDSLVLT